MELYFLGTGAGMPSRKRNVTSIALRLTEDSGAIWLFDCGEGTQHQILKSPVKPAKMEKLFVTHLHGDHLYGIPGLLTSRSYQGGTTPLQVYGPPGIREFIRTTLTVSGAHLDYELDIIEYNEGFIYKDDRYTVSAALLEHRIDSYGFRIVERDQPGKLDPVKLAEWGIPPGPLYAQIKKGLDVALADGRTVKGADFVGPNCRGRTVTILGDTRVCSNSRMLAEGADVLVHEATFDDSLRSLAYKYYHSTAAQAALTAREADVKALIVTHLSSRYQEEEVAGLLAEAQAIFPNTYVAEDFWNYSIPKPNGKQQI